MDAVWRAAPAFGHVQCGTDGDRCRQAILLGVITIWVSRLKKTPKNEVMGFFSFCFLISGVLHIVFSLNTDMI